jgi:hypothetical protein
MLQVLFSSSDNRCTLLPQSVMLNRLRERKGVDGFRIFITNKSVTLSRVRVVCKVLNCGSIDDFCLMHV